MMASDDISRFCNGSLNSEEDEERNFPRLTENAGDKGVRDLELNLARWKRFVELDPEEGLREAGLSKISMGAILSLANCKSFSLTEGIQDGNLLDMKDGRAMLLAILGRGVSPCEFVDLADWTGEHDGVLDSNEAIALCANVRSNPKIKALTLYRQGIFGTPKICTLLSCALRTNHTLINLKLWNVNMSAEAVRLLLLGGEERSASPTVSLELDKELTTEVGKNPCDNEAILKLKRGTSIETDNAQHGGLQGNLTVKYLDLGENPLSNEGIVHLAAFLRTNSTVEKLNIRGVDFGLTSARHMSDALKHNRTLKELELSDVGIGYAVTESLLEPLSCNKEESSMSSDHGPHNTTIKKLVIDKGNLSSVCEKDRANLVTSIVRMIDTNKTLISFRIRYVRFHSKDWIHEIFPALSRNETLEELGLISCGGLMGDEVRQAFIDLVQNSNTGLKTIRLNFTGIVDWQGKVDEELRINREYRHKLRNQPMVTPTSGRIVLCGFELAGKTTIRNTMERIVEGSTPCCLPFNVACQRLTRLFPVFQQMHSRQDLANRTRGFDILVLNKHPRRTSVWDFAGQKEYYALHDYLFQDIKNSCFLYIFGCTCQQGKAVAKRKMEDEFYHWLRFIASNSKPPEGKDKCGVQLPSVQFVLTKKDTLGHAQLDLSIQEARGAVDKFRRVFKDVIDLSETVEVVNGHDDEDVGRLISMTDTKLTQVLEHQKEYEVCQEVRNALDEWSTRNLFTPIMSLDEFQAICEGPVKHAARVAYMLAKLDEKESQRAVLAYLNDMGDVIYPKGLNFIVVNPRWFGIGILGSLIDPIGGASGWKVAHEKGFVNRTNIKSLLQRSLEKTHLQQNIPVDTLIELMKHLEICFEGDRAVKDSDLFFPTVFDDEKDMAAKGLRQLENWKEPGTVYFGRRLECQDKSTTVLTPGLFPILQVHLVNHIRHKKWIRDEDLTVDRNLIHFAFDGKEIFVEYSEVDFFVDVMVKSSKPYLKTLEFIIVELIDVIVAFCSSPHGCSGVTLVQAVIRPLCVRNLHVCNVRKDHSVLVSFLEDNIKTHGDSFLYNWPKLENEKHSERALDLLEGPQARSSSLEEKHVSNARDRLPKFYLTDEVGLWSKGKAAINVSKLKPFKLHLYCDGLEDKHKVQGQPGRNLTVYAKGGGSDFKSLQPVVKFLAGKVLGTQIDEFVSVFFKDANLSGTDYETLQGWIKSSKTETPADPQEVMNALADHIVGTGCLKQILKVEDDKFREDFRLQKVTYADGKIGWLCKEHHKKARDEKILKSYAEYILD